ncbi:MAG: hypothetical protein QNJ64_10565 [Crocosphaera sp.]|nr:hypothetical protein [Crocosphaera sp.]
MSKRFDYNDNKDELVEKILKHKDTIKTPYNLPYELSETYKIARILDELLMDYFRINTGRISTVNSYEYKIDKILKIFKQETLTSLGKEKEKFRQVNYQTKKRFKNIFEFSKSENLYLSNMYTRFISEKLGHKFEEIANLSNKVYLPDQELGIKLKGIDLIIYDQGLIKYTQLKTKKDTLTGSQKERSIQELSIHPYSIFAAALNMGNSLTISKKAVEDYNIELLIGESFWSLIDLDYDLILNKISKIIRELDKELY